MLPVILQGSLLRPQKGPCKIISPTRSALRGSRVTERYPSLAAARGKLLVPGSGQVVDPAGHHWSSTLQRTQGETRCAMATFTLVYAKSRRALPLCIPKIPYKATTIVTTVY